MLSNLIKSGDWKEEKHVPVIHVEKAKKGECVGVKVIIGEEQPHPNTFEHHISWIKLFFKPESGKAPLEIGEVKFSSHGESDVTTNYVGNFCFNTEEEGTLYAMSFCNIHGLWESEEELKFE